MATDYTPEEAEAILQRAAGRKSADSVSHQSLLAMAEELGLSPAEVERAAQEVLIEQEESALRQEFIAERRASFIPHLVVFVLVNLFLIILNLLTRGSFWAIYPLLGWGLGLAIHGATTMINRGTEFEKEFQQWRRVREAKEQKRIKRSTKKAGVTESQTTVETPLQTPVRSATAPQEQPQTLRQRSGN